MRINRPKALFAVLIFIISALLCFIIIVTPMGSRSVSFRQSQYADEYVELLGMISELYIGELDRAAIHYAAMDALVAELDDWSFYISPEEYSAYMDSSSNRYTGIGVEVLPDEETGGMGVVRVYQDSPADIGGVLAGDVITHIDGEPVSGSTLDMRDMLARPIGDYAVLTVIRGDSSDVKLTVMYGEVFVNPVVTAILDNNIGYVRIRNFEAESGEQFISAVDALIKDGVDGIIYDVRGNGGGRVVEMTMILDFLLPEGEIFIQINKSGQELITRSDSHWIDMPAVVLVDRYSFSAAEFFAALLSEYDYAAVVGEQTTGKSRSQTTHELSSGGALHISTGQYMTKNRVSLFDNGGFTPDYEIVLSEEDMNLLLSGRLEHDSDPQLQLALSLLSD